MSVIARRVLLRVFGVVGTLAVLSVIVFAATEALPGDVVGVIAGPTATAEQRAEVVAALGLDRPAAVRYLDWVTGAARGDFGTSFVGGRPIADILADRLPTSLLLAAVVLVMLVPTAVVGGTLAGLRAGGRADRAVSGAALTAAAVPEFLTAAVLATVVGGVLGWLPAVSLVPVGGSPLDVGWVLVLPAASLLLAGTATTLRLVRAVVADAAGTPHVEAARLAGVRGPVFVVRHVLPGTLGPVLQAVAAGVGALVGGAVVVETVFGYPGIGLELARAVASRDLPLVQGIALALATVTLVAVAVADTVADVGRPGGGG